MELLNQCQKKKDYYVRKLNSYLLKTLNQGLCYLRPNAFITDIDIHMHFLRQEGNGSRSIYVGGEFLSWYKEAEGGQEEFNSF